MVWCEFIICHPSQWRLCSCSSVTVTLASAALNIIEIRTQEFSGKHNAGDCISQSNSEHHLYFFSPSFFSPFSWLTCFRIKSYNISDKREERWVHILQRHISHCLIFEADLHRYVLLHKGTFAWILLLQQNVTLLNICEHV